MPASVANEIDILAAVTNTSSNYCALAVTCVGGYTVNWGDGTTPTAASSGATAQHQYIWGNLSSSTLAQWGYRQALIKITPTVGGNAITAIDLGKMNTATGLGAYSQPWLDIQVNAPSCTSFTVYSTQNSELCQRVNIVAIGSVTSTASMFYNCHALQSVTFPAGSLVSVTATAIMFYQCSALQSVTFPAGSLASVTSTTNMFYQCSALQSVTFPIGALASVTDATNMFYQCPSLQSVTFPAGSLVSVTGATSMFYQCSALQSVTFPAGSLVSVTATTYMFNTCSSLAAIAGCYIPITFSVASCNLAGAELNAIFTALPTVTAQTITVTGNHGVNDAGYSAAIATAKGWTVTN